MLKRKRKYNCNKYIINRWVPKVYLSNKAKNNIFSKIETKLPPQVSIYFFVFHVEENFSIPFFKEL